MFLLLATLMFILCHSRYFFIRLPLGLGAEPIKKYRTQQGLHFRVFLKRFYSFLPVLFILFYIKQNFSPRSFQQKFFFCILIIKAGQLLNLFSVSYTHLDVYKRQVIMTHLFFLLYSTIRLLKN